jgi:hypothetical protein
MILLKRKMAQGPATIDLDFAGGKAVGKMSMGGQDKTISVDLGGSLFADGPGANQLIATLPLAEGFTTTYRNFDAMAQKVKLQQLKVTGTETVTVPAGKFDAFRIEVFSVDGGNDKQTLWVAKDSRKVVKSSTVLSSMGGATMTLELTE